MRFSRFTIIIGMLFFVIVASDYFALAQAGPESAVNGLKAFGHLHDSAGDNPGQRTAGEQKQKLKEVSAHFKSVLISGLSCRDRNSATLLPSTSATVVVSSGILSCLDRPLA
jgi:hypothetical protein